MRDHVEQVRQKLMERPELIPAGRTAGCTSEAEARAVLKAAQEKAAREENQLEADARAAWKAAQEKAAREEKMGADREPEPVRRVANIASDFLAGAVAATISKGLTYPFRRGVALIQLEGANPVLGTPATPLAAIYSR